MEPFVKGMTDAEIMALAAHYAKLPPEPSDEPVDQALAARRKSSPSSCAAAPAICRTTPAASRCRGWPSSASTTSIDSLTAYRDGARYGIDTSMNGVMVGVSDSDIRALAHYLATVR